MDVFSQDSSSLVETHEKSHPDCERLLNILIRFRSQKRNRECYPVRMIRGVTPGIAGTSIFNARTKKAAIRKFIIFPKRCRPRSSLTVLVLRRLEL